MHQPDQEKVSVWKTLYELVNLLLEIKNNQKKLPDLKNCRKLPTHLRFPDKSLVYDILTESLFEFREGIGYLFILYLDSIIDIKYWELLRGEWREFRECHSRRPIDTTLIKEWEKHLSEEFDHTRLINIRLTHIDCPGLIWELLGPEKKSDHPCSLFLTEHRIIGSLEVHKDLSPEKVRIRAHLVVEWSRAGNTPSLLLCIMWKPTICPMELKPKHTSISSENFAHCHAFHRVKIINSLDVWSESSAITLCYIRNFCYWKSLEKFLYTLSVKVYIGPERFIEVTEHLRPDTSIGYSDWYRYSDISVDSFFQRFCEVIIPSRDIGKFNEKLINWKHLYLTKFSCKIFHKSIRYFSVPSMVWLLHYEFFPENSLCFPDRCANFNTQSLTLIACSNDYLIPYCNILSFEWWISQNFARSIKRIAINMCKDASWCMEKHILVIFSDRTSDDSEDLTRTIHNNRFIFSMALA